MKMKRPYICGSVYKFSVGSDELPPTFELQIAFELPLALASGRKAKNTSRALAQSSFETTTHKEIIELFVEWTDAMMLFLRVYVISHLWQQTETAKYSSCQ